MVCVLTKGDHRTLLVRWTVYCGWIGWGRMRGFNVKKSVVTFCGIECHYGVECSIVLLFHIYRIFASIQSIWPLKRARPFPIRFVCSTFYIPLLFCYGCLDTNIHFYVRKTWNICQRSFERASRSSISGTRTGKPTTHPLQWGETSLTLLRQEYVSTDIQKLVKNETKQSND